jgi:hypothetical protein
MQIQLRSPVFEFCQGDSFVVIGINRVELRFSPKVSPKLRQ